jgi:acyl-CoA thioesterase
LFTLGDYAFALAANAGDESGLAISSTINFVKAAPSGTELYATAQLVSRTNRIGTYRIDITDDKGVILAAGQSTAYFKKTEK